MPSFTLLQAFSFSQRQAELEHRESCKAAGTCDWVAVKELKGVGFRAWVQGLGFRFKGLGLKVKGLGSRV